MTEAQFWKVLSFIFGSLIGSFLNVVIARLPSKEDLVFKPSHCRSCGNQIKWYMNIPLISYTLLRGKCNKCGAKISIRYFLIELTVGLMALYLLPTTWDIDSWVKAIILFTSFCILICHFFIDIDHQILPDSLNILLLSQLASYSIYYFHWQHWAIGAAIGFGGTLAVTWLFYLLKGQIGLGGGDIKLFGVLGFYLGPIGILNNLFLSCMVGTIFTLVLIATKRMKKSDPIAFGPFIIIVAICQMYFGDLIPIELFKIQ